jgi:trans-aconitate methyltransferase
LYQKKGAMGYEGPEFYDNEEVFETYSQRRLRADNPNDTLEKPVVLALIGRVEGKHVLDLGCGDAALGMELLVQGAASYLGLDGSHKMVEHARSRLAGTAGQVEQADIRTWAYPANRFDCILARLVLHYITQVATL